MENWKAILLLIAMLAFIMFMIQPPTQPKKLEYNGHHMGCDFVLTKMPTLADSIDAMLVVHDCRYTRDSLLPLVRGDSLRDLPEQR